MKYPRRDHLAQRGEKRRAGRRLFGLARRRAIGRLPPRGLAGAGSRSSVPRHGGGAMQTWVDDELATADLGDQRLNQRFRLVLDRLGQKPSLKFPAACRGQAEIQAAYRFLDNDRVTADKVLAPHRTATLARLRAQPVALLIQDTTDLDVTRKQERMAGAGPLNDEAHVGFYDHVLVAVTPAQVMLGVLDAQIWARDPEEFAQSAAVKAQARKTKTIEEKESVRWLEGYRH